MRLFRTAWLVIALTASACSSGGGATSGTAAPVAPHSATSMPSTTPAPSTTVLAAVPATSADVTTLPATTTAPSSTQPSSTSPATTAIEVRSALPLTQELADDLLAGRDNGTIGGALAREVLVDELSSFAQPLPGFDTYEHPFDVGTNLAGVVPGTDLADEYVIIGAHYDHLGGDCRYPTADDVVCNGAADNAAGVAVAIEAARAVAAAGPRRSVVVALWDAEEDGLLGSRAFVADPPLPLGQVVAYVNLDLLGASLLPSLSRHTVVIGAESGGPAFEQLTDEAVAAAGLTPVSLSIVFGEGRSDHAPFAASGVPVVFFSDSTNGCYHTVDDEIDRIDVDKLDRELQGAAATLAALATGEVTPAFDADTPLVAFDDVVALRDMVRDGEPDLDLLGARAAEAAEFLRALDRLIADGPEQFDGTDVNTVLEGASLLVSALAAQDCTP